MALQGHGILIVRSEFDLKGCMLVPLLPLTTVTVAVVIQVTEG